MKTRFFALALSMVFVIAGCGKKEDKNATAGQDKTKAAKVEKGKVAKKNNKKVDKKNVKKDDKKVVKGVVAKTDGSIKLSTVKPLEIGTPAFAVHMSVEHMAKSPLFADLTDNGESIKMDFGGDFKKIAECLGSKAAKAYEMMTTVSVIGMSESEMAIILGMKPEAKKFIECAAKVSKDMKKITFQKKDAYQVNDKDDPKKVLTIVAADKNAILIFIGNMISSKIKIGEGQIGKGNVAAYFEGYKAVSCIKAIVRDIPIPPGNGVTKLIPGLKSVSADVAMGMPEGFIFNTVVDLKDPQAAKGTVGFANMFLNGPQAKAKLTEMGIDASILKALKLTDSGSLVSASVKLDKAATKSLFEKLKALKGLKKGKKVEEKKAPAAKAVKKAVKKAK
ncbi:MAG: hypothetical protein JXR95_01545 [Deltaproteobacteria bacterium]|nr:hypothetical protein [Deltaproteobacteria bacterium]